MAIPRIIHVAHVSPLFRPVFQVVRRDIEKKYAQDGALRDAPKTGLGDDQHWPTFTHMTLLEGNVAKSSSICVLAPWVAKAFKQCWKLSLLKAFA